MESRLSLNLDATAPASFYPLCGLSCRSSCWRCLRTSPSARSQGCSPSQSHPLSAPPRTTNPFCSPSLSVTLDSCSALSSGKSVLKQNYDSFHVVSEVHVLAVPVDCQVGLVQHLRQGQLYCFFLNVSIFLVGALFVKGEFLHSGLVNHQKREWLNKTIGTLSAWGK